MPRAQTLALVVGLGLLLALGVGAALYMELGDVDELDFEAPASEVEGPAESAARRQATEAITAPSEADPAGAPANDPGDLDEGSPAALVLVVDDGDQPVARATVHVLARARGRGPFTAERNDDAPLETTTTDRRGVARIRLREEPVSVEAEQEGRYGRAELDPDGEAQGGVDLVVTLRPIKSIEVAVVDTTGVPVPHIMVAARSGDGGGSARGRGGRRGRGPGRRGWGGATQWTEAPSGLARFRVRSGVDDFYDDDEITVRAQLPGLRAVEERAALKDGLTRVKVTIPPTAAIDLTLKEAGGDRWIERTTVLWTVQGDEDGGAGVGRAGGFGFFERSMFGRRQVEDGRSVIGGFAPGTTVTLRAAVDGRLPASTEVALPDVPQIRAADLVLGAARPHLLARLLESDGRPVASTDRFRLDVRLDEPAAEGRDGDFVGRMFRRFMRGADSLTVEADGRVRIPVVPAASGRAEILSRDRRGFGPFGGNSQALASVAFEGLEPGETRDVGDVTIDRGPVLAAGRVVDASGEPRGGVRLRVSMTDTAAREAAGDRRARRGRGRGPGRGGFRGRGRGSRVTSGADGTFVIHGEPDLDFDYAIEVDGPRHVGATVPFAIGDRDVVVTVVDPGGLNGTLRYADERFAVDPEVRVRAVQSSDDRRGWRRFSVDAEGRFRVRRLPPGLYELQVRLDGMEVLSLDGVEIPAGQIDSPPRLQGLLVGTGLSLAEVVVRDEAGAVVPRARVELRSRRDGGEVDFRRMFRGGMRTDAGGRAEKLIRLDADYSVRVRASGFSDANVAAATFPLTVVMTRGRRLTVAFSQPLPEQESIRGYRVALFDAEEYDPTDFASRFRAQRGSTNVSAGGAEFELDNLSAGRYVVTLQPRRRGQRGFRDLLGGDGIELGTIEVPSGRGDHRASLVIDAAAILASGAQNEDDR